MGTKSIESDVVVVGSGIAGAMAARTLASKGRSVSVIEQGIKLSPQLVSGVFDSESFVGNPQIPQIRVEFSGDEKRTRPLPSVVGGLARFYSGVSLRMRQREFDKWPFTYDEIEPYYTAAEQIMKISGNKSGDLSDPPRSKPHPLTLPPMSEYSKKLSWGADEMGLSPFQHPFAINFDAGCIRCNHCNQVPCSYNAKWSPDSLLAESAALPITVYDETSAVKIRYVGDGGGRRVEYVECLNKRDGSRIDFRAGQFVLACGAILTPKLMIASGMHEWNPLIGTHLMTHCLGLVVGFFPFRVSQEGDFHKWWSVGDYYFDEDGRVRGLIQQDHLTARKKVFAKVPKILHALVAKFYYNTCQILVIAEDDPRTQNCIGSDMKIRQSFTTADEARRKFLADKSKRIMKQAGALMTFAFNGKSVYHACGTCRMGESMADSVTDSTGLVRGTQNLYAADASLFPTSSGVNPSLTIAANALRTADLMT